MTTPSSHHDPAGVVVAGLTKSYGAVRAVRGIDLSIERGETVALLGPNGAGKSTTLDLVLGLGRPDAGTVSLFGRTTAEAVAAGMVGGMLQTGAVISELSVREVLVMMASLYPEPMPVDDVIAAADLADIAARRTNKLSGGQVQRVRFALALVANPQLLVLDEPTVGLDVDARRNFWATMRAGARSGKTIVFATHYLDEADAFADRIVLMAGGLVVADGSTTEIKARAGGRVIRATLPDVPIEALGATPGVTRAERHGDSVELVCADSDRAIRAVLQHHPDARDIEIRGAGLEEAFLELTTDHADLIDHSELVGAPR
ncbi:MAG: ABC transporter ATP-binding protein [Ilumatobacteraceae bacterium]